MLRWLARRTLRRPPDFYVGGKDNPYMKRWYAIPRNPFFNIYVHEFMRSDDDIGLHDHPWVNVSVILEGEYYEEVPSSDVRPYKHGDHTYKLYRPAYRSLWKSTYFRWATQAHRIEIEKPVEGPGFVDPTFPWRGPISIFFTGPKIRKWGFYLPDGWRPHDEIIMRSNDESLWPKSVKQHYSKPA